VTYILILDWIDTWRRLSRLLRRSKGFSAAKSDSAKTREKRDSAKTDKRSHHKMSWKLGAWVYTIVAIIYFLAGLLRVDTFPFYSWSLYNWHPSEPGNKDYWNATTATTAAQRCMTMPPYNPSCQNHGTTKHHDRFPKMLPNELTTITVVADRATLDSSYGCSLAIYQDWKPHACHRRNHSQPLDVQLKNLMINDTMYDFLPDLKKPPQLPIRLSSGTKERVSSGIKDRTTDAAAAAIDEGPSCFEPSSKWSEHASDWMWSEDENPYNPASRLARHIRTHMPGHDGVYIPEGKTILAMGIFFFYSDDVNDLACLLGSSLEGEKVNSTFSNHQVGAGNQVKLPKGDWSEVNLEAIYVLLLFSVIASYKLLLAEKRSKRRVQLVFALASAAILSSFASGYQSTRLWSVNVMEKSKEQTLVLPPASGENSSKVLRRRLSDAGTDLRF